MRKDLEMSETDWRKIGQREGYLALKAIVEKDPDHVDENATGAVTSCQYLEKIELDDNGGVVAYPSCVVGHWLVELGVPAGEIMRNNQAGVRELIEDLDLEVPPALELLLFRVQSRQDEGMPWSEALIFGMRDVRAILSADSRWFSERAHLLNS